MSVFNSGHGARPTRTTWSTSVKDLPGQRSRARSASRCAAGLLLRRRRGNRDTDGVVRAPQTAQAVPFTGTLLCLGVHDDEHAIGVRLAACQRATAFLADWRRQVKQGEDMRELGARGGIAGALRRSPGAAAAGCAANRRLSGLSSTICRRSR